MGAEFIRDESGQDAVEYALLLGFVVAVSVASLSSVLDALKGLWTSLNGLLSST